MVRDKNCALTGTPSLPENPGTPIGPCQKIITHTKRHLYHHVHYTLIPVFRSNIKGTYTFVNSLLHPQNISEYWVNRNAYICMYNNCPPWNLTLSPFGPEAHCVLHGHFLLWAQLALGPQWKPSGTTAAHLSKFPWLPLQRRQKWV